MKKLLYLFHRRFAVALSIPLVLWALSGMLHPMMANWFKPHLTRTFLPPKPLVFDSSALPPAEAFPDLKEVHQLKVISLEGQAAYLAITPEQSLHYRWLNGTEIVDGHRRHAIDLARAYLDDVSSPVEKVSVHEEFSSTYTTINRYLPAYRVQLQRNDSMEVVVDLRTGKLASYDNSSKRVMLRLFSWFHTWSFLGSPSSPLRIIIVGLISFGALLVAFSGLASILFIKRPRSQKTRLSIRWHRFLGLSTAVIYLMFGLSGFAHLLMKLRADDAPQQVSGQKVSVSKLNLVPQPQSEIHVLGASLAIVGEEPYYRLLLKGESRPLVQYTHSQTGLTRPDAEEEFARQLALEFSGYRKEEISETELINEFRSDYGFIFKRLPVWRVSFPGKPYWQYTVDTADSHLSMRTDLPSLIEALGFINFHKWHFLDFAGRETRDWATVIGASSLLILFASGLCMVWAKRKKQ